MGSLLSTQPTRLSQRTTSHWGTLVTTCNFSVLLMMVPVSTDQFSRKSTTLHRSEYNWHGTREAQTLHSVWPASTRSMTIHHWLSNWETTDQLDVLTATSSKLE